MPTRLRCPLLRRARHLTAIMPRLEVPVRNSPEGEHMRRGTKFNRRQEAAQKGQKKNRMIDLLRPLRPR